MQGIDPLDAAIRLSGFACRGSARASTSGDSDWKATLPLA
jgi:hypothetical protein